MIATTSTTRTPRHVAGGEHGQEPGTGPDRLDQGPAPSVRTEAPGRAVRVSRVLGPADLES